MCWNADVSLQTFLLGSAAIVVAGLQGVSAPILFFCATIVSMQLIEYVVWSNYDNPIVNRNASLAAAILLWIQPIASILTLPTGSLMLAFLLPYLALSLYDSLRTRQTIDYSMTRAANGHLQWNWLTQNYKSYTSLAVYFLFLFTPMILSEQYELVMLALLTLAITLYTYWKMNTWGSMWCWIVNGLVLGVAGKSILKT